MLNTNDRIKIENQILNGMMNYESFFLQVYDFNPNPKDLFRNISNKVIYKTMIDSYIDTGIYPSSPDIYTQLILNKSSEEIKNHFTKNILSSEIGIKFDAVRHLLEDSIEADTKEAVKRTDKQNLSGLEYAETLREDIDKIILEGFEKYKKDNRTNEQKVVDLLNNIQSIREGKANDYIPTGFKKLDEAIIGLPKSHLTTIASRPGMGKTSFMLQLKRNLVQAGYKPLIISIEMTSEQLLIKDISAFSMINSLKIESGQINNEENEKITEASNMLKEENYFIEDDGVWTIEKIKSIIRRYISKEKIDIVFLDYLTLVRTSGRRDGRFDLEIGEITNSLREFAKETGLPIVILSQLNRDLEKRPDKKPILADLRESGSIEQNSKTVLFLFRPAYYGIDGAKNNWISKENMPVTNDEFAEIIIAKARSGKTGIVSLIYRKEIHSFEDAYKNQDCDNFSNGSIKSYYEKEEEII
jgi:replicative DNA helicase